MVTIKVHSESGRAIFDGSERKLTRVPCVGEHFKIDWSSSPYRVVKVVHFADGEAGIDASITLSQD